ncbi:hypothetical protein [Clostridium acetobutylicum]|uniref:hypothetical protein n=1 Tax=Clostridium acetobutylicum TaxID=1488 RepID=UPI001802E530|nr:hypothetical protein [Clostridium acetobutylicum]NYC95074.1 hypothetical protein [Clostridium acetobutylicum]
MKNFSQKIYKENKGVYKDPSAAESNKIVKENTVENPKEWEKQVWWWRQYLDIFIENYFSTEKSPVRFYDFQKVIVRECGNCSIVRDTEARSMGKTFKMSRVLAGLAILYPQNKILIVSNTVRQAILTVKYINDLGEENANFAREIIQPIKISKDGAKVKFKKWLRN